MPGKAESKKPKKYKPTKADIYENIAAMINHDSYDPSHTSLEQKFYVTMPEVGSFVLIEEYKPGLARVVPVSYIVSCLIKHLCKYMVGWSIYSLDVADATKAVHYWINCSKPAPSPLLLGQKSSPELCFHRLPWDYENARDPTPFFDEFLNRCTNQQAFACYIGSLFEPNADRSQYFWCWGDGGDGKGTLTTMLSGIFGPTCCSPGVPVGNDKFWTVNLHKKRLAIISECESSSFLTSALFKALTGNDAIQFENKGEKAFSERPEVRFLFSSQHPPHIVRGKAHERRLICSYIAPPILKADGMHGKGEDGVIPYQLMNSLWWAEAPSIIRKCLAVYRVICPTFGPIPTEKEAYEDALSDAETYYDGLFYNYFELEKDSIVRGAVLESILDKRHVSFSEKRHFRNYLRKLHKIEEMRDSKGKYWKGIREKPIPQA